MKKMISLSLAVGAVIAFTSPVLADGATVFEDTCSGCHGENGKGAEGMNGVPDFTNAPAIWAKSDDALTQSVIKGIEKPGAEVTMPPRAGDDELTDAQIKETVVYMRKTFAK
ncbi:putative Cytochrome c, class I [Candidatus Terasakiella magnetica]|uniref:Putative Cytochrome c, class I n=1 Tax=Candidatus Terasakiella magnetica TaxID=1867952 RepID=A0A1C3RIG0_9PROT|nr:c-type cytochrome [Candidatus Terasakiella magnetica]SCA57004.1 putative Cytochrome c, class I [Candidatus Terasakiella magnetica]